MEDNFIGLDHNLSKDFNESLLKCKTIEDLAALIGSVHWFGMRELFSLKVDIESKKYDPWTL